MLRTARTELSDNTTMAATSTDGEAKRPPRQLVSRNSAQTFNYFAYPTNKTATAEEMHLESLELRIAEFLDAENVYVMDANDGN